MTTIVTKIDKFMCYCLPMGVCVSGFFSDKLENIVGNIKGVQTYIEYTLVRINYIPYLVYIITWGVVKPDLRKTQGIMNLRRPKITKNRELSYV